MKDLVRRGQKARAAGRWTEAYEAYKAAFEATDAASSPVAERAELAGEIGLCELALRRYRDAAEHLTQSLERRELLPIQLQRRVEVGQVKAAFYVGTLLLSVDPPDAEVLIDGKPVAQAARSYKVFLEPGRHLVRARALGREEALHSISAVAGVEHEISMQLPRAAVSGVKEAPATPRQTPTGAAAARPARAASPWDSWPGALRITGIAVTTAGISAGTLLMIRAGKIDDDLSARRDRLLSEPAASPSMCWQAPRNSPCGELRRLRDARNLSGRAGVATVIAGGVIGAVTAASFFVDLSFPGGTPARERVHVSPVASGGELGARIEGLW
ncbi:tetratricopeptide repeat protein [Sorangium sp. So ce406]|uniref:tetratricopeptide repeat protein n=1 Tax=Sorangium sp. So ce406 TaxID=3133311 RepID=UPI003F5C6041